MSNIFTYEIDEQSLRIRLRGMESPVKEEAWSKFQAYELQNPVVVHRSGIKGIEINLNRNVVLPFVFGGIIILFSFLLFNFISIKNPSESVEAKAVKPVKQQELIMETEKPRELPKAAGPVSILPSAEKAIAKQVSEPVKTEALTNAEVAASETTEALTENPEQVREIPVARRKAKKQAEFEEQLRPEVVTDEAEAEVVPKDL